MSKLTESPILTGNVPTPGTDNIPTRPVNLAMHRVNQTTHSHAASLIPLMERALADWLRENTIIEDGRRSPSSLSPAKAAFLKKLKNEGVDLQGREDHPSERGARVYIGGNTGNDISVMTSGRQGDYIAAYYPQKEFPHIATRAHFYGTPQERARTEGCSALEIEGDRWQIVPLEHLRAGRARTEEQAAQKRAEITGGPFNPKYIASLLQRIRETLETEYAKYQRAEWLKDPLNKWVHGDVLSNPLHLNMTNASAVTLARAKEIIGSSALVVVSYNGGAAKIGQAHRMSPEKSLLFNPLGKDTPQRLSVADFLQGKVKLRAATWIEQEAFDRRKQGEY